MTAKIMTLGGHVPIDILMRADGEEVLRILERIEQGVFS
ncbi:hypothetical protein [Trichloromonas sp.]|nr:hypothetical protein [Trichloromonas sp.]